MLSSPKVVKEKNEALTRFLRAYIEAMAVDAANAPKEIHVEPALSKFPPKNSPPDREILDPYTKLISRRSFPWCP